MLSRVSWCERVIADPANFMLRMMERQGGQSTGCSSQTCGQKQECKFALDRDLDSYAVEKGATAFAPVMIVIAILVTSAFRKKR
jgi:hypothetical protein